MIHGPFGGKRAIGVFHGDKWLVVHYVPPGTRRFAYPIDCARAVCTVEQFLADCEANKDFDNLMLKRIEWAKDIDLDSPPVEADEYE